VKRVFGRTVSANLTLLSFLTQDPTPRRPVCGTDRHWILSPTLFYLHTKGLRGRALQRCLLD